MQSSLLRRIVRVFIILLITVWYLSRWGRVTADTLVSYAAYPVYRCSAAVQQRISTWQEHWQSLHDVRVALHATQQMCQQLRAELVAARAVQLYAAETAELRDFSARYELACGHIAQVLLRHCSADEQILVVDAGARQGIQQDMIALSAHGIVGRVIEVFPWYSRVLLVTDRRCKIPVVCAATKTDAIYEGANAIHEGQLCFVSCLQPLLVGDMVLTSGKGMIYPAGFAVGVIKEITQDQQGLYYTATITPHHDPFAITHCMLVSKEAMGQRIRSEQSVPV